MTTAPATQTAQLSFAHKEPLRIGLASFAHVHAATYAKILAARPDVELRVADPTEVSLISHASGVPDPQPGPRKRGQQLAEELGVPFAHSYAELFDWCQGAIICTETSRHREVVEEAAAAGVDVLSEKPLATNVADAEAIVQACRVAGVHLQIAYPVRFHPGFVALRDQVRAGRIGRVQSASGTNNGQAPFTERAWFASRELAGGGAMMDHVVHLADLLDLLLDSPPVEVYAQTNQILHGNQVDIDTGGLVVVTYEDGTVATIDCSWSAPATFPTWGGLTLRLQGDCGAVHFNAFSDHLDLFDDRDGRLSWPSYGAGLNTLLLDEFLRAVRTGTQGQPDGVAGLRTLRLVAAAYRSANSGMPEPI